MQWIRGKSAIYDESAPVIISPSSSRAYSLEDAVVGFSNETSICNVKCETSTHIDNQLKTVKTEPVEGYLADKSPDENPSTNQQPAGSEKEVNMWSQCGFMVSKHFKCETSMHIDDQLKTVKAEPLEGCLDNQSPEENSPTHQQPADSEKTVNIGNQCGSVVTKHLLTSSHNRQHARVLDTTLQRSQNQRASLWRSAGGPMQSERMEREAKWPRGGHKGGSQVVKGHFPQGALRNLPGLTHDVPFGPDLPWGELGSLPGLIYDLPFCGDLPWGGLHDHPSLPHGLPFSPDLCHNCFGRGHWARDCREPVRCRRCGGVGHTERRCLPARRPSRLASQYQYYNREEGIPRLKAFQSYSEIAEVTGQHSNKCMAGEEGEEGDVERETIGATTQKEEMNEQTMNNTEKHLLITWENLKFLAVKKWVNDQDWFTQHLIRIGQNQAIFWCPVPKVREQILWSSPVKIGGGSIRIHPRHLEELSGDQKVDVKEEKIEEDPLDVIDHILLKDRLNILLIRKWSSNNYPMSSKDSKTNVPNIMSPATTEVAAIKTMTTARQRKRKRTATDSVETALGEDAPELLQVLVDEGINIEELKLYEVMDGNDDLIDVSSIEDSFTDLGNIISKLSFERSKSLIKLNSLRDVESLKASYSLSCLISLIQQAQYLQLRKCPVEWGWCRDLQSFIFVFEQHNRIVLERPEYGYATYFFELVESFPVDWQIKRLVIAMKLTNCSRIALIENKSLTVGQDLTEGEARILQDYGWRPHTGLASMLNFCDRVMHDRRTEMSLSEWKSKIGKLLMNGYDGGRIVVQDLPRKVMQYIENQNSQSQTEFKTVDFLPVEKQH